MPILYFDKSQITEASRDAFANFETNPLDGAQGTGEIIALQRNGGGQEIVAYADIYKCPTNDYINFLEVAPEHRGQRNRYGEKFSYLIYRAVFERCAQHSGELGLSRWTPKGQRSLPDIEERLKKEFPNVQAHHVPSGA